MFKNQNIYFKTYQQSRCLPCSRITGYVICILYLVNIVPLILCIKPNITIVFLSINQDINLACNWWYMPSICSYLKEIYILYMFCRNCARKWQRQSLFCTNSIVVKIYIWVKLCQSVSILDQVNPTIWFVTSYNRKTYVQGATCDSK